MTAKILQVVNSAYFGIRRKITAPEEAVRYLGLENISALVLAANVFGQMEEKVLKVQGFSMASLWSHSGEVGRLAQLGTEGVLLLCGDSTNADRPGFSPSEAIVGPRLEELFMRCTGRIVVTCFASNIHRGQACRR